MSDETKKLFDAPWKKDGMTIRSKKDNYVCSAGSDNINRIFRLPELYEALMEAAHYRCWHCRHEDFPDFACIEDFEKNCKTTSCGCREWWKLLKKVRDGK